MALATVLGLEVGGSPLAGQTLPQSFACCSVGRSATDAIGGFDTAFTPAYFEDSDYFRRVRLANLGSVFLDEVLVEHDRSRTSRVDPQIAREAEAVGARNRDLYIRKWGGPPGSERFTRPYDDERWSLRVDLTSGEHDQATTWPADAPPR